MRRFLKNILVFGIIVVVLLCVGEIVARGLPSPYADKDKYIMEHGQDISTLILGSSHAYYGLNPSVMGDSTFNLANVSQSPEYDLALLRHYMPYMPNLKTVIISVSYFTYRDPILEEGADRRLAIPYKTRMHLPVHSDFSRYNLEISDFGAYSAKLANLVLRQPENHCDSLGFGLGYDLSHREPHWQKRGEEHARRHTMSSPGRFASVMETQRALIRLAQDHGCRVVFITTPAWHTYASQLDASQETEMRRGMASLHAEFGVDYYDFLRDDRFGDSDFYDPDHLSDRGARKFSEIIASRLR